MSQNTDDPSKKASAEEKPQMVYIVPQQDSLEEDEIDLWQLVLPLIKYKLQIVLILFCGIAVGFGYMYYKRPKITNTTNISETLPKKLIQLDKQLKQDVKLLLRLIEDIPEDGKRLVITAAEFQYALKETPGKTYALKLDSFLESKKPTLSKDIILTIESRPVSKLKQQLKESYTELIELEGQIQRLMFQNRTRLLTNQGQDSRKPSEFASTQEEQNISYPEIIQELTIRQANLNNKILMLHETLSNPLYFDLKQNKIPWSVWEDFRKQIDHGEDQNQKQNNDRIKTHFKAIKSVFTELLKTRTMEYLINQNISISDLHYNWPAVLELKKSKQTTPKTNTKKILLISIIALFIGVFSVYIRLFLQSFFKGEVNQQQKREFLKALKYWKL